jgi:Leucine-rich repeat (LRR) protein
MTREELVRRIIERTAERKLIEMGFSGLELEEVPLEIVKCTHLTKLWLNNNQITQISEVLGQLFNLTWLSLSNNQITSIPEVLGQLSNLRWLELDGNQITSIPEALRQLPNLKIYE